MNTTSPTTEWITPLQFKYWRSGRTDTGFIKRIHSLDAKYLFVIADSWGFGEHIPAPHENMDKWADHVRNWAQKLKGSVDFWEPWNEPDQKIFWPYDRQSYFQTWKTAYKSLRDELGEEALIVGPSLAKFDKDFMTAFMDFALQEELEVNIISWHSIMDRISAIPENVEWVQQTFINNPKYARLNIKDIHIDEFGGLAAQYSPGTNMTYIRQLEKAKVSYAARACWPTLDKDQFNCDLDNLVGFLDNQKRQPRSIWWFYKTYADIDQNFRYDITGETKWLPTIAWKDHLGQIQLLIGLADATNAPEQVNITINLPNSTRITQVERLKATKENISPGFQTEAKKTPYRLEAGEVLRLTLIP